MLIDDTPRSAHLDELADLFERILGRAPEELTRMESPGISPSPQRKEGPADPARVRSEPAAR